MQTKDDEHGDMDLGMDFDLLDSDADKKSGQKRPRRRVIVDTKDANGRAYSAAEIRRMKRCARPTLSTLILKGLNQICMHGRRPRPR